LNQDGVKEDKAENLLLAPEEEKELLSIAPQGDEQLHMISHQLLNHDLPIHAIAYDRPHRASQASVSSSSPYTHVATPRSSISAMTAAAAPPKITNTNKQTEEMTVPMEVEETSRIANHSAAADEDQVIDDRMITDDSSSSSSSPASLPLLSSQFPNGSQQSQSVALNGVLDKEEGNDNHQNQLLTTDHPMDEPVERSESSANNSNHNNHLHYLDHTHQSHQQQRPNLEDQQQQQQQQRQQNQHDEPPPLSPLSFSSIGAKSAFYAVNSYNNPLPDQQPPADNSRTQ